MSKIVFLDVDGTLIVYEQSYLIQQEKLLIKTEFMAIKSIFVQVVLKMKSYKEIYVS